MDLSVDKQTMRWIKSISFYIKKLLTG